MRFALLCAATLVLSFNPIAHAQDSAPSATPSAAPQSAPGPGSSANLTFEQRRERAVEAMQGGRISRPKTYESMTPEQQAFVNSILSGQRRGIDGSLGVMMPSPGLGDLTQKAIAYARFNSTVPVKYNEMAILMAGRSWSAQVEFRAHHNAALKAGVSPEVVDAIKEGKRPANMPPDVEAVYNFCDEMLNHHKLDDATYAAALKVLGSEQRIVDLTGTLGMYSFVSMLMTVDQTPLPKGATPELAPIDYPGPLQSGGH